MNEKVKKFFNGVIVFFAGIGSALLCVLGAILHHNRKRVDTTRTEQPESQGRSEAVEGRLDTVESRLDGCLRWTPCHEPVYYTLTSGYSQEKKREA